MGSFDTSVSQPEFRLTSFVGHTLVAYLPPEFAAESKAEQERIAREILSKYGDRPRIYRNGVGLAVPDKAQIEALRRAVRYLLATEKVDLRRVQLRLTKDQLEQLRERQRTELAAAESALRSLYTSVWLPRAEGGVLGVERVEVGGRPLQATGIHERVMELLTSVGTPKVHGSVTPRKLVEVLRLGEPLAPGELPLLGVELTEVQDAFFSFLGAPRLETSTVIRRAVVRGVSEGVFAYTSGAVPGLGTDDRFQIPREKIVIGRSLSEDEVDFDTGFLMSPKALPEPAPADGPGTIGVPGAPIPDHAPSPPGIAPARIPPPGSGSAQGNQIIRWKFKAKRSQMFQVFPALANLADKSDGEMIVIQIEATSASGFDPSWLRNAVEEPLDEANVEHLD